MQTLLDRPHAVWATPAPAVCTARWNEEDWRKFEEQFRPADYTGGRIDMGAWVKYKAQKLEEIRQKFIYPHLGGK